MKTIGFTIDGENWSKSAYCNIAPGTVIKTLHVADQPTDNPINADTWAFVGYVVRGDLPGDGGKIYQTKLEAGQNWIPVYRGVLRSEHVVKPVQDEPTFDERLTAIEKSIELLTKAVANNRELDRLPPTDEITFIDLAFLFVWLAQAIATPGSSRNADHVLKLAAILHKNRPPRI